MTQDPPLEARRQRKSRSQVESEVRKDTVVRDWDPDPDPLLGAT